MKALVLREPGKAVVEEVPEPVAAADRLLLRVRMVGLCGSDLKSYQGMNPLVTFPRILGHEVAATIDSGLDSATIGTRNVAISPYTNCGSCASCCRNRPNACQFNQTLGVQRDGAMTEFITMPEEKVFPSELALRQLCLVEPLTVGFHAVARGRVSAEDKVAVFGCGGVGLGAISAAHFCDSKAIAIDVDDDKLALARLAGASHTINTSHENLHHRLLDLTDGHGPDVVIEAVGLPHTFRSAVEEVAFTGRVVYIGYAKEHVSYETRLFVQKELDIMGSRNALPEDFRQVIRMLEQGAFPVNDAISAVISLEDVPKVLQEWSLHPARFSKIMVALN